MKTIIIAALVGAELAMLGSALPKTVSFGSLFAPPPPVDRKWAKAMARKVDADQREGVRRSARRQAIEACIGPKGPAMSPTRYDAALKRCEARLDGAPADAAPTPYDPLPTALAPDAVQAAAPAGAGSS